jgi:outer membrane protein TolC
VIKVQNNPSLNFVATGGFKNGYFNEYFQDVGELNFAVGVGLKVPIFDANRSKYTKIQANAELEGNQQETELTRRNITNEVVECRANAEAAQKKVKQSELQLQQALQAYDLADVSYKAGAITNLDLLDSYTALSESKLALFKTKVDYSVNLYRLKIALGEQI